MKVLEVSHVGAGGEVLWRRQGLRNTLHLNGEEFLLLALFTGGQDNAIIPANYFAGLDNRATRATTDTMSSLSNEPSSGGYDRQPLSSTGGFTVTSSGGHFRADTAVVTFRANGGSWGPVANIFLTTAFDDSGYLISTASLGSAVTVQAGNTLTVRLGLSLRDC